MAVCSVADTVSPKRMGAALTYARRYALFTLVGIAGEDDLDAPDLNATATNADGYQMDRVKAEASKLPAIVATGPTLATAQPKRSFVRSATAPLEPGESAELRDRVIAELDGLPSADEAADWVHRRLPTRISRRRWTPNGWRSAFGQRWPQSKTHPPMTSS
jgi:ERF superfamily